MEPHPFIWFFFDSFHQFCIFPHMYLIYIILNLYLIILFDFDTNINSTVSFILFPIVHCWHIGEQLTFVYYPVA